jgi:voltage-gated potassium channel
MTVITITTIGYGEVISLNEVGRFFTIFIAITGIGSLFYSLTVTMEYLVMSRMMDPLGKKKMLRDIHKLDRHIIIAGLGRVGRQAAAELHEAKVPFVIVDPRQQALGFAVQHNYLVIQGDASDDSVLEEARIQHAKGMIVTSGDDASNLYIVLSARVLKPDLFIVSRAVDDSSVPKLIRAGADRAISPYAIGGRRLAHLILSPTVVDFFDTVIMPGDGEENLNLEGIRVNAVSPAIGRSLADIFGEIRASSNSCADILVVLRDGRVLPNPGPELVLMQDDQLLALGTSVQLDQLESLIS